MLLFLEHLTGSPSRDPGNSVLDLLRGVPGTRTIIELLTGWQPDSASLIYIGLPVRQNREPAAAYYTCHDRGVAVRNQNHPFGAI